MKKHRLLLPILAFFLGLSGLSGCGNLAFSSLSTDSLPSTSDSSSSSRPGENETLDLTASPLPHQAVSARDEDVFALVSLFQEDVQSLSDIPSEVVTMVKDTITKSFLTPSQVEMILRCLKDIKAGFLETTYAKAAAHFVTLFSDLQNALKAIDGDQLGYLLQNIAALAQRKENASSLPSGFIFSLKNLSDYQGALAAFGQTYPGFLSQYSAYSSYFDGSVSYQQSPDTGILDLSTPLVLALGRLLHHLLLQFATLLNEEEKAFLLSSIAFSIEGERLPYGKDVREKLDALKQNPVSVINRLGLLLLSLRLTPASWNLIHDEGIKLGKAIIGIRKAVYFRSKAVNVTLVDAYQSLLEAKKNIVTGEMIAVLVKFLGNGATLFSAKEWEALQNAQGENPVNPVTVLLALYDKAYESLTDSEKAVLRSLFTNLGLSYEEIYSTVSGWKTLDFKEESARGMIDEYLQTLMGQVTALFTPEVKPLNIGVYPIDPVYLPNAVLAPKAFDIDVYSANDSEENYAISSIVAPTDKLGYHEGSFILQDKVGGGSYTFRFGYAVIPSLLGLDPYQYPSFSSPEGNVTFANGQLYVQAGMSVAAFRQSGQVSIRFREADNTAFEMPLSSLSLELVFSTSQAGDGFLLLVSHRADKDPIYGVIKVHFFSPEEVDYATNGEALIVVQGGNNVLMFRKILHRAGGEEITLSHLTQTLARLEVSTASLGEQQAIAHYHDTTFSVTLNVVAPSACKIVGITGYAPYLKTSYSKGEAFSLTALELIYNYGENDETMVSAGTLRIENPEVSLYGFSTDTPAQGAVATFTYADITISFTYSVYAVD